MPRYAEATKVSSEKSRLEIERTLTRYGANAFSYGWETGRAVVMFRAHERHIKFELPLPARADFRLTPTGLVRSEDSWEAAYEQAVRQRWRALVLIVKAKLEAVEAGIVTFEQEFLAHVVLPDGETVGAWLLPQVAEAYKTGGSTRAVAALRGRRGPAAGVKAVRHRAVEGCGMTLTVKPTDWRTDNGR